MPHVNPSARRSPTHTGPHGVRAFGRAFSLIEMLVVLLILTVVISIVVPALQSFRNAARKSATVQLMAGLSTSVAQFKMSQNRLPGHYSPKDMGSAQNTTYSGMENMLLDLAGGITTAPAVVGTDPCDSTQFGVIEVGPTTNNKINVDINRIGAVEAGAQGQISRGYFKPDPKFFVRQCKLGQRKGAVTSNAAILAMPVLVDAWGQPILAWVNDPIPDQTPLVSADSTTRAHFYHASNRCFTEVTTLGKLGQDQTDPTTGSMLAGANAAESVAGIVGNPAFHNQARAPIIFHSAGANGVYIGRSERGGRQVGASGSTPAPLPAPFARDYFQEGDFDDFVQKAE